MPEQMTTRPLIRGDIRKLNAPEKKLFNRIKKIRKAIGPVVVNSGAILRRLNDQ